MSRVDEDRGARSQDEGLPQSRDSLFSSETPDQYSSDRSEGSSLGISPHPSVQPPHHSINARLPAPAVAVNERTPMLQTQNNRNRNRSVRLTKKSALLTCAAVVVLLVSVALLLVGVCGLALTKREDDKLAIFSYHTQLVYKSTNYFQTGDICFETSRDYPNKWSLFLSDCSNQELNVVTSQVDRMNITARHLDFYFHFEERSFVNISAAEGGLYYRFTTDVSKAMEFKDSSCHDLDRNSKEFHNITQSPFQIFESTGYYHICYSNDRRNLPSFSMTVTEFYYDVPVAKRNECSSKSDDKKHEKCCKLPTVKPCVYFLSGISSEDPVTQLTAMNFHITYSEQVKSVSGGLLGVGVVLIVILLLAPVAICCYWRINQTSSQFYP